MSTTRLESTTFEPLGANVSVHHMPEAYYERELYLITAQRRAELAYLRTPNTQTAQAFARAMRRLTEHENSHNTH